MSNHSLKHVWTRVQVVLTIVRHIPRPFSKSSARHDSQSESDSRQSKDELRFPNQSTLVVTSRKGQRKKCGSDDAGGTEAGVRNRH